MYVCMYLEPQIQLARYILMTGDMPFEQDPRGWIVDLLSAALQASQTTFRSFGLNVAVSSCTSSKSSSLCVADKNLLSARMCHRERDKQRRRHSTRRLVHLCFSPCHTRDHTLLWAKTVRRVDGRSLVMALSLATAAPHGLQSRKPGGLRSGGNLCRSGLGYAPGFSACRLC